MGTSRKDFIFHRIHTLSGVAPVGLFLMFHLFINSFAIEGAAYYNQAARLLESLPFLAVIEFLFILAPITYHAIYGLYVAFTSGYNTGQYGWFRNLMFTLQRITGVITFVFITYHLVTTRFSGHAPTFELMHQIVKNPFGLWFMLIGIVAAVFHFSNGLWSFFIHWGITVGPRSQRVSAYCSGAMFVVLGAMGILAIIALHP